MKFKKFGQLLKHIFVHNWGMKLASLLFAILLWSYVDSSLNTMRIKSFENVQIFYDGESALTGAGLVLLEEPEELIDSARVSIDVLRNSYDAVTVDNLSLRVNLSRIQQTGEVTLPLVLTTSSGTKKQIYPAEVTLHVDTLETGVVPVEVQFVGAAARSCWTGQEELTHSAIRVTGPASLVSSLSKAVVTVNIDQAKETIRTAGDFTLLDKAGNVVESARLSTDTHTVGVTVPILKKHSVTIDPADGVVGQDSLPEGYEIKEILLSSDRVTVAGNVEDFEAPVTFTRRLDVRGQTETVNGELKLRAENGLTILEGQTVTVTVVIGEVEETLSAPVEVTFEGQKTDLSYKAEPVQLSLVLPYSRARTFDWADVSVTADVSDLAVGEHTVKVKVELPEDVPSPQLQADTVKVTVTAP